MPDDRLAEALAELYGEPPEAFTGRRAELTAAAKDAGDRTAAKAIGALRRPTRAAWVVNQLARADPGAPLRLAELGGALRAAQQAGHGPRLRELSGARGALIDALTAQALSLAGVADAAPALRLEVSETLGAALADAQVGADFAAGRLTRAVQWSGFGVLPEGLASEDGDGDGDGDGASGDGLPSGDGDASGAGGVGVGDTGPGRVSAVSRGPGRAAASEAGDASKLGAVVKARGPAARDASRGGSSVKARGSAKAAAAVGGAAQRQADAERRRAEAAELREREAAERAARRREQRAEAEQGLAVASAATAAAEAEEDRLEAEVRDLEQQLVQARSDLSAARMRARHAESAERRAQQALNQLPTE